MKFHLFSSFSYYDYITVIENRKNSLFDHLLPKNKLSDKPFTFQIVMDKKLDLKEDISKSNT